MAKANKSNDLSIFMKDLADTIRQKTGVDLLINPQDFSSQISSLGGGASLEVEDITALTTAQINKLDCGDIVNKGIDGNKHAYLVSYKEDEVGICLTYVDAENVETVSYDYIDSEWVYNSTDYTKIVVELSQEQRFTNNWVEKTWTGLTDFYGEYVWTNGNNIYYSKYTSYPKQLINGEWVAKSWTGLAVFDGNHIWKDNNGNIYYSSSEHSAQKQLINDEWIDKTWNGLTSFDGNYVWKDNNGTIYYSKDDTQKQLVNGEWVDKVWSGSFQTIAGRYVWTDGNNIYYSNQNIKKQLINDEWVDKTWTPYAPSNGSLIWKLNGNIYFSGLKMDTQQKQLINGEWVDKTWTVPESGKIIGSGIWTDGTNTYYSYGTSQYQLQKETIIHKGDLDDVKDGTSIIVNESDIDDSYNEAESEVQALVSVSGNNITFTNDCITTSGDNITINAYSTFGTNSAIYL